MRGIFLDDERSPEDVTWIKYPENVEWFIVRNSIQFFQMFRALGHGGIIVSFDHDLQISNQYGEVTGYSILQTMLSYIQVTGLDIPTCYFHTKNPIGKENMEAYYRNFIDFYNEEWEK